jgi:hypothetical protein
MTDSRKTGRIAGLAKAEERKDRKERTRAYATRWNRLGRAGRRSYYQERRAIDLATILRPGGSLALPITNH